MTYTVIPAPVSGASISKGTFGDLVKQDIEDHETRIAANASALNTKIGYTTYMPAFLTSGGFVETSRFGDVYSSFQRAFINANTGITVRSIIHAFMLAPDANAAGAVVNGFKAYVTTSGGTLSYRLFTGTTLASLTGRGTLQSGVSNGTTGLRTFGFSGAYSVTSTDVWGAVQILTSAAGPAFGTTTVHASALLGGKWGEYTTATTAVGSSLNASADTTTPINANSVAWVAIY